MKKTGTKFFCALLCAAILSVFLFCAASAATVVADGACGAEGDGTNIAWTLTSDGSLTFSGDGGAMADYTVGERPWDAYADRVKKITFDYMPDGIDVGDYAFAYSFPGVTSILLGRSVTHIGSYAFAGCTGVKQTMIVNVPVIGEGAFEGCTGISVLTLDENVTEIEAGAFRNCTALQSVDIKGRISSLPDHTFENCSGIRGILLPGSIAQISSDAVTSEALAHVFYGGDASGWTQIAGSDAPVFRAAELHYNADQWGFCGGEGDGTNVWWSYCKETGVLTVGGVGAMKNYSLNGRGSPFASILADTSLTTIRIEEGVTAVGSAAFYDDNYSRHTAYPSFTVQIPESVTQIGSKAFEGCVGATEILLPDSVTSIGEYAFYDCDHLVSLRIPSGVTVIERSVFASCNSLTGIEIPYGVTSIGEYAFSGCELLASPTLPETLQTIGAKAFGSCASFRSFTVPDSVTSFGERVFQNCQQLQSVTLGEGITEIPPYTFYECTSLKNVTLPDGVTEIGEKAFLRCRSLMKLALPLSVTSIGSRAFEACNLLADLSAGQALQQIGADAFKECFVLIHVFYTGSAAGWEQIERADGNDMLDRAALHTDCAAASLRQLLADHALTDAGKCGYNDYSYNCTGAWVLEGDGTLTVGGSGRMTDFRSSSGDVKNWKPHKNLIKRAVIREGVTNISSGVFQDFPVLTQIVVPSTVTEIASIGSYSGCASLQRFDVDENNEAYASDAYGCLYNKDKTTFLRYPNGRTETSYNLADSVTLIKVSAFSSSRLEEVVLPEGIQKIESYVFQDCANLHSMAIPAGIREIGAGVFSNCVSLQGIHITDIRAWNRISFNPPGPLAGGRDLYLNGEKVTDLSGLYGETSIGYAAFYGWSAESIVIPDTVTVIGTSAFNSCPSLESVVIPASVATINTWAFSNCPALKNVTLAQGLTSIGNYAFKNCTALTEIDIPYGVEYIGSEVFRGCSGLVQISLPDSLTSIGSYLFTGCHRLASLSLPDGITEIDLSMFTGCSRLEWLKMPASLRDITYQGLTNWFGSLGLRYIFYPGTEAQWQEINRIYLINDRNYEVHFESVWHTPGNAVTENEIPATCTECGGYDLTSRCTVCGYVISDEHVDVSALGHTYESEITLAPTCTEPGVRTYTCIRCPETYTEAEPATGHGTLGYDVSGAPSTCTVRGYSMTVCIACGDITAYEEFPLDPANHNWGEWTVVTPATYLTEGLEQRTCGWCGDAETRTIPALEPEITIGDPDTGIELQLQQGVLPENTVFTVDEEFDGTYFRLLNREVGNVSSTLYNITPTADGEKVQPDGYVLVRLPIPAGYNPDTLSIYYISTETGATERMDCYIENGYICFQTTHFSVYAIVDASSSAETPTETPTNNGGGTSLSFFARISAFFQRIAEFFRNLFRR